MSPGEHVEENRAAWVEMAAEYAEDGRRKWEMAEPVWGIWEVAESELRVLPDDVEGLDTIELGCGTGYVSAWLARRGARPVGLDNSAEQLATARELQRRHRLEFPLRLGDAEAAPFADASFDLAISEFGASIWCDPYAWVPEAARLLRPGGRLIFIVNSPISILTDPDDGSSPAGERLCRPQFGMLRFRWQDEDGVDFHLPHGEMLALLRANGFAVEELNEYRPPAGARTRYTHTTLEWARRWPGEEIWKARKE